MRPSPDLYLDEQLAALERLVAERDPTDPNTKAARRLAARCRYYLRRGLSPLKRRYLLADIRSATRTLEGEHHA